MRELRIASAFLLCPWFAAGAAAQEPGADGQRWYEVEVSVFTNEYTPSQYSEIAVPEKANLLYLPRLRELLTRTSSFDIEFPEERPAPPVPALEALPADGVLPPALPELPRQDPIHSPARPDSFHIADPERDPFIDLGERVLQFTSMTRELDRSGEHRVLWHKVWRQPLVARAQTPAVFIAGGAENGAHHELEGSLRLSDGVPTVLVDVNLWLNRFSTDPEGADPAWQLPPRPYPVVAAAANASDAGAQVPAPLAAPPAAALNEVWQLEQTHEIGANQVYYFDHPAVGVLLQIRPYVVPPSVVPAADEDF